MRRAASRRTHSNRNPTTHGNSQDRPRCPPQCPRRTLRNRTLHRSPPLRLHQRRERRPHQPRVQPALDSIILRLHTETACRRGGALALTSNDLDPARCLIRLTEKGETVRWQPVSPTLMSHLLHHAESRSAPPNSQILRYADGRPITKRRYDHLWQRIGRHLPWVTTQQISTHWLRHTTPHLGRTQLRLRHRPRLRRPHRRAHRRHNRHLRQSHPLRTSQSPPHRRTPPTRELKLPRATAPAEGLLKPVNEKCLVATL